MVFILIILLLCLKTKMMRFICYILSIYFITLISVPCVDSLNGDHSTKTEMGCNTNGNHQHNNGDQCSPFCTCNCCATPVIYQDFDVQFHSLTFIEKSISTEYTSAIFSCHLSSIWQPPQMA